MRKHKAAAYDKTQQDSKARQDSKAQQYSKEKGGKR